MQRCRQEAGLQYPTRKRVVICSPPWSYETLGATPPRPGGRDLTGQGRLPELGLHFLTTTLRQRGHQATAVEGYGRSAPQMLRTIRALQPELVGISIPTALWPVAQEQIRALRATLGERVRIVVGGPHATLRGGSLAERCGEIDAVFVGPAEASLLAWIERGMPRGGDAHTPMEPVPHDDAWVRTHVSGIDWRRYRANLGFFRRGPIATSVSSYGCQRSCASCHVKGSGGGRARGHGELLLEQRILGREIGVRGLCYLDDDVVFTRRDERAEPLLRALEREGPFLEWSVYLDQFDLPLSRFESMRRAGCRRVMMLVEAGDDAVRAYAKGRAVDQRAIIHTATLAHRAGLEVGARFQIGFPDETPKLARASIELALELPLTVATFMRAMAYPGSRMEAHHRARGLASLEEASWSYYGRPVRPDSMSEGEQRTLIREGILRFYGRPRASWRLLRSPPPGERLGHALSLARRVVLDGLD